MTGPLGPWTLAALIAAWIITGTLITLSWCRAAHRGDQAEQDAFDRQFDAITQQIEE
ncbi:hypothetical protein OHV05_24585 [Kitasatospora sp. NBC_00070]|uniref:hypothetical protein n=1 Tax=Kitasatospora sp. NBC_00070 TaxID=2975962 RepID=UPI00324FF353